VPGALPRGGRKREGAAPSGAELVRVPDLPETLDRRGSVDLHDRNLEPWIRLGILFVFLGFCAAGAANVFGQKTAATEASGAAADLEVEAPSASRGGLIYQVRFRVHANRELIEPALVLEAGWFEGLTINTFEPEPAEWEHRDGRNVLVYGPVEEGDTLVARLQFQVNPTAVGNRQQGVVLEDGGEELVRLDHDMTIFP
jgi:hypothetical protein